MPDDLADRIANNDFGDADTVTTRHWLVATSPRRSRGHRYG